jgi:uncharacterized damage-inducible protein DinB
MPVELASVPHYYHGYIKLVKAANAYEATGSHLEGLINQVRSLSEEDWTYSYAPGKWTIKELVQHIMDAERIFCYRALSIARMDPNHLPGFDEDAYASCSSANSRTGASLLRELTAMAASTKHFFASFNDAQLSATGIANGLPISVNAIAFIVAGHAAHHTQIVRVRYLDKTYRHEPAAL